MSEGPNGEGLGVLLIPGIEGDARTFWNIGELGQRYRVWAVDLPERVGAIQEVASVIWRDMPNKKLLLVGLSFGGLVARAMVEQQPSRVAGMVALGTLPSEDLVPAHLYTAAKVLRWMPNFIFQQMYRNRISARHKQEGVSDDISAALLASLPSRTTHRQRLRAVLAWRAQGSIGVPAMWLMGQTDTECPWSKEQVMEAIPEAIVKTVPGGHRAPLTHPGPFVSRIQEMATSLSVTL